MKSLFCIILLSLSLSANAQLPNPFHKSVKKIAERFVRKYPDDSSRAVAMYQWLNNYLTYDYKAFQKYKWKINQYSSSRVLYRRKAVCSGFSKIYQELCKEAGITCVKLEGYVQENPDDAYVHTYYATHAWNAVKINEHWYLCDLTFDNGYTKIKKRTFLKLLNLITSIPFVYNKSKYVHHPAMQYCMNSNIEFYYSHYPLLPNALFAGDTITIIDFKNRQLPDSSDYSPHYYTTYTSIDTYCTKDKIDQLRSTGSEGLRNNTNNHLNITVNYFNSVAYSGRLKNLRYNSSLDTINKYGRQFLRDNQYLHTFNLRRITQEHNSLMGLWKKQDSYQKNNALYFYNGCIQYKNKGKISSQKNLQKSILTEMSYEAVLNKKNAQLRANDTITYEKYVLQHHKLTYNCDTLRIRFNKDSILLERTFQEYQVLFNKFHGVIQQHHNCLKRANSKDILVQPYPQVLFWYQKADSLSLIINRYKDSIQQFNRTYMATRGRALRWVNLGYQYARRDYSISSALYQSYPESSFYNELYYNEANAHLNSMKSSMQRMSSRDEVLYATLCGQYKSLYKKFRKERKIIRSLYTVRLKALQSRNKHENSRFNAYQALVEGILKQVSYIKK